MGVVSYGCLTLMKETLSHRFNPLRAVEFGGLMKVLFNIEIEPQSQKKIRNIRQLLKEHPLLNAFLYINHIAYSDPGPAMHVAHLIDPWQKRKIVALASHYYLYKSPTKTYAALIKAGQIAGVFPVPAIQAYQVGNPAFDYSQAEASANYRSILTTFRQLHQEGPLIAFASPEGHRSDTLQLQAQVETGMIAIGKQLENVLYVPVCIQYAPTYNRNGLNVFSHTYLTIGETYLQEGRHNAPEIKTLMDNLANALPPNMRGPWGTSPNPV